MTSTANDSDSSAEPVCKREMLPISLREIEQRAWRPGQLRISIVYAIENWEYVERLVNELRYELKNKHQMNVLNIKIMQCESIHEIPQFIARLNSRSQIIYAVGVEFKTSPLYEPRLVDLLTRR
ncbi:hypothetical protein H4S04_007967, partial [Coemansia sp. S16]